ncbi:hypothetical protein GE21DRAFT_8940 [Neurospora crassa]|uniref:Uncharacterized protein n=1 Tax=Neurospora crassa (strain ATCC 24698 / 74-OR23-1A / CBS 708.71 / DSM 1257 / FGSC 987) TaxID=367110 RepID=V5IKX0_NEUCR|nr:hypothetical protein NCU12097 [Neurospora crassa OR74A]ESA42177.1 hypothetical protein NCU12097 [Neurospora crassa OR74A]KHE86729.1 hypothetical protein GE21DRAFT_8940 [Neurospora crassa]|eukprot:XP_011395046.1 hypothetical protein NCU12097 [Neurospora crassa OR74A]
MNLANRSGMASSFATSPSPWVAQKASFIMLFVSCYSFVCLHCDRSCTIEEAPSPWITWQDKFRGTRGVSVVMKENSFRFWYVGATNAVGAHRALGACWDCGFARQMHEVSVFFLFPLFIFIFLHSYAEEAGDGGVWVRWMQVVTLLSSFSGRLGHEMGAAELAQRYPAWLEGCHCFGGNRSFPEFSSGGARMVWIGIRLGLCGVIYFSFHFVL